MVHLGGGKRVVVGLGVGEGPELGPGAGKVAVVGLGVGAVSEVAVGELSVVCPDGDEVAVVGLVLVLLVIKVLVQVAGMSQQTAELVYSALHTD